MPFCSRCGRSYQAGQKFCEQCGTPLEAPPPQPSPPPQAPASPSAPVTRRRWPRRVFPALVGAAVVALAIVLLSVFAGLAQVDLVRAASPETEAWVGMDVRPTPSRMAALKTLLQALDKTGLKSRLIDELDKAAERERAPFAWEENLQPWVGYQAGVSVSHISRTISSYGMRPPTFLAMVTVRSQEKAEDWLSDLASYMERDRVWKTDTLSRDGLKIHVFRPRYSRSDRESLAFAVSRRVLFSSNDAEEIVSAVGRIKGDKESCAKAEWYRHLAKQIPKDAVLTVLWSPSLIKSLSRLGPGGRLPSSAYAASGGGAEWLEITKDALHAGYYGLGDKESASKYARQLEDLNKLNAWETGFTCIPKDSVGAASFLGISQFSTMLLEWLDDSPFGYQWRQAEADINRGLGLGLRDDVLGWIDGVSAALLGFRAGPYDLEEIHAVGEVRAKQGERLQARVERLEQALERGTHFPIASFDSRGVRCRSLPAGGPAELCWAVTGDSLLIASSRTALENSLSARDSQSDRITTSEVWKQAQTARGHRAYFAFLLDVPRLTEDLEDTLSDEDREHGGREALEAFRAVSWCAASAGADGENGRGDFAMAVDWERLCKAVNRLVEMGASSHYGGRRTYVVPGRGRVDARTGRIVPESGGRAARRGGRGGGRRGGGRGSA